jgi:ribosomal protein S18 acetylase RimI-like enzyme
MSGITIRSFTRDDIPAIRATQLKYAAAYPGAAVVPEEAYGAPAFENGRNIFCAVAPDGCLIGFASIYPTPVLAGAALPRVLWTEIKIDPALTWADRYRDLLFERVLGRVSDLAAADPGRSYQLIFQYLPAEAQAIAYIAAKGAVNGESIYRMRRDLARPIPRVPPPAGIDIRPWHMPDEADQLRYVEARNEAFPEEPILLKEWRHFLQSQLWAAGTSIAAFDGEELVGSVTVYWDETEKRHSKRAAGYTENIFVRPAWRNRGIARSLVRASLLYLRRHGLTEAHLEVRARNAEALRLYRSLRYEVAQETYIYVLDWPAASPT